MLSAFSVGLDNAFADLVCTELLFFLQTICHKRFTNADAAVGPVLIDETTMKTLITQ